MTSNCRVAVPLEKRVPVANAARGLLQLAYLLQTGNEPVGFHFRSPASRRRVQLTQGLSHAIHV